MSINSVGKFSTNIMKKAVTQLGKSGALLPVVLLEVSVDAGRAYQAKKRGGVTEMRERMIEDISAGIFWLFGASMFNKLGDKIGKKLLKIENPVFSTGVDKARDCLKQGIEANSKNTAKLLTAFKFSKVACSIATAVCLIGWVLPKVNQAITKKILNKKNEIQPKEKAKTQISSKNLFKDFSTFTSSKEKTKPSFGIKLSPETLGKLAHNFEHNATYRLAATDGGILVGRTTNARTFDEGLEYGFRDLVSSYFYLLSTGHIISLINKFDKYKGKNTGLDPSSAVIVNNHLASVIQDKTLSIEDFKAKVFGNTDNEKLNLLKETFKKNKGNISVEDFCELTNADDQLRQKAKLMSKLQPQINGVSILTDKQALDVLTDGAITDPKFLYDTINGYFGSATKKLFGKDKGKVIKTSIEDKLTYFSITEIENFQKKISDYVESVIEIAKNQVKGSEKPAEITMEILKKASKRNAIYHSSYLLTGIGISALFLSTLIPKMQYWITKKRTGKDGFPGVDESNIKNNTNSKKA